MRRYLHGEVVAVGLIVQLAYNGSMEEAERFRDDMKRRGMAVSLTEMGVEGSDANRTLLYEKMLASSAMAGTTEEEHQQLMTALRMII